jgi:parvulin-like peptidyl-prolyl isomerase
VRAERRKRAEEALRKVKKKGADFAALAGEYDEGSSKVRGGDLGLLARNRLGKAVEEVVWPLKVGEVRLVETPNGFQIVKKTEQKESRPKTLDEMKDRIERMVLAQKRSEASRKVFTEWKSAAKIEVLLKGDKSTIAGDGVTVPSPSAEVSPSPGTS